jgi:hypothetical protein
MTHGLPTIQHLLLPLLLLMGVAQAEAADDDMTVSPHQSFKILQHRNNDGVRQSIQFNKGAKSSILLDASISWPAQYYISPDEKWILRIQKSGSGDNISFLYHLDEHGKLWRKEDQIGDLGFAYLARQKGTPHDLYHTGIKFKSWDLSKGQLRFSIHGSDVHQSGHGIDLELIYKLKDETISEP